MGVGHVATPDEERTPFLEPGDDVDGFRIVRLLGSGGMGDVYLARDTRLGRKVALKVVRPRALDSEEALDRFMFEARVTARFSHPHIVTIYAVGEHRGSPYLALEYLEGQSLRERTDEQNLSPRECFRVGLAIAEALVEAHRHKVLHRDLKPENVHWPRDGRLRVLDFGLAKPIATEDESSSLEVDLATWAAETRGEASGQRRFETSADVIMGTPMYMAPEQWRQQPCTAATDIWALGVILFELLSGHPPFVAPSLARLCVEVCKPLPAPALDATETVPAEVEDLVARCMNKDPSGRPTAEEAVAVLRSLLGGGRALFSSGGEDETNPFRGLLPFTEHHADLFFGREAETAAFLERLRHEPVLPVVGPSGAGKSSFVQAGVIPRLREQGRWLVLQIRPGAHPFRALASRLGRGESDSLLRPDLTDVDEVDERAKPQQRGPSTADDWDGDTIQQTLREQVSDTIEHDLHERPPSDGAEATWEGPAQQARLRERLIEAPTVLSLLLQRLAERSQSRVLLLVDQLEELYTLVPDEEVRRRFMEALCRGADDPQGPVRVVFTLRDDFLGRVAETAAARDALGHITVLRSPDPEALRQTLEKPLAIVGYTYEDPDLPGEMLDAVHGEAACLPVLQYACSRLWERRDKERRTLTRAAYAAMGGVEGALARLADDVLEGLAPEQTALAREIFLRLVTPEGTRRVATRDQLLDGLDADAGAVLDRLAASRAVLVRRGREGAAELELVHESLIRTWEPLRRWLDEGRDEVAFLAEVGQAAELWRRRGRRDEEVWRGTALHDALRRAQRCVNLPEGVRTFLDAGAVRETRSGRRRQLLIGAVMAALVVVAVVLGALAQVAHRQSERATVQADRAETNRAEAERRHAQALRDGARAAFLRGEMLEARAKLRESLEAEDSPMARALWGQLTRVPLIWKRHLGGYGFSVAVSPDGSDVTTVCASSSICVFNVKSRQVRILRGSLDRIWYLAYSPDGRSLVSGTQSELRIWDVERGSYQVLGPLDGRIRALAYHPDGHLLATSGSEEVIQLWDMTGREGVREVPGHEGPVMDLSFAPDGRTLASAGFDRSVRLWDVGSWTERRVLRGHDGVVMDVSFSPDGRTLASASQDGTVRIWDATSGAQQKVLRGHAGGIVRSVFNPDGRTLATGSNDGNIWIWDAATGEAVSVLQGHDAGVIDIAFDPESRFLATTGFDARLKLWSLENPGPVEELGGHVECVWNGAVSPDSRLVASVGNDHTVRIWDVEQGRAIKVLRGHDDETTAIDFSPDGRLLASGSADHTVRIWDVATGSEVRVLRGHTAMIWGVRFAPGGETLVSSSQDKTIRMWDMATGGETARFGGDIEIAGDLRFSPDGKLIATGSRHGPVFLLDLDRRGTPIELLGHMDQVWGVAFSPDGETVVSGSSDRTLKVWDLQKRAVRSSIEHSHRIYGVEFHPDGLRVGFASADRTGRIRELGTGKTVSLSGHLDEVNTVNFSPDGKLVATTSDDSTVRLWDVDTGSPVWRTTVMLPDPPEIHTHEGWTLLDAPERAAAHHDGSAWRQAIEQRARSASVDGAGEALCVQHPGDVLEIWDTAQDRQLVRQTVPDLRQVVAVSSGCLVLVGDRLGLIDRDGVRTEIARDVTAVARAGEETLVASGGEMLVLSSTGERRETRRVGAGVTALGRIGERLVLGFNDGNIELLMPGAGESREDLSFEDTPATSVTTITEGPPGILIVGYANGILGLWSSETGAKLQDVRLHGPVRHVLVRGSKLHAASELGQHVTLDLDLFSRDYCDLLREVWRAVPVVWQNGQPVERATTDHGCISHDDP